MRLGTLDWSSLSHDQATLLLSHELVEVMTDPVSHQGNFVNPPKNAPNASDPDEHRIADYEPEAGPSFGVNGADPVEQDAAVALVGAAHGRFSPFDERLQGVRRGFSRIQGKGGSDRSRGATRSRPPQNDSLEKGREPCRSDSD
jgi:hypothetical protein